MAEESWHARMLDAQEDMEFYARQRYEADYRRRHGIPEPGTPAARAAAEEAALERRAEASYLRPIRAVQRASTGWHFLPVAALLLYLLSWLVERGGVETWQVWLAGLVGSALSVAHFLLTVHRHRDRIKLRGFYGRTHIALAVTRGVAVAAVVAGGLVLLGGTSTPDPYEGVWDDLGVSQEEQQRLAGHDPAVQAEVFALVNGAEEPTAHGGGVTWLLGAATLAVGGVGLTSLFGGMRRLR